MDNDIDAILKGTEPQPTAEPAAEPNDPAPPAEATPAAENVSPADATDGQPRDDKGRFASKGETHEAAPPAAEETHIDHPALIGERRRRQEAEERARQLEAQLAQFQAPKPLQQPPVQEPPDRWADPDGYDQWLIAQSTARAAETARSEAVAAFQNQRIVAAAEEAKSRLPDYVEKIGVFERMMNANPRLLDELQRAPNPAQYAYDMASIQIDLDRYGGIDGMVNARVEEALKAKAPGASPSSNMIPDSLAAEQSARTTGAVHEPLSLDQILHGR